MNSCDERFRDKRDLAELLEIADRATNGFLANDPDTVTFGDTSIAEDLRARYEALIARRQAEDEGAPV